MFCFIPNFTYKQVFSSNTTPLFASSQNATCYLCLHPLPSSPINESPFSPSPPIHLPIPSILLLSRLANLLNIHLHARLLQSFNISITQTTRG